MIKQVKANADFVIEVAFEAVNPLGGVYAVLSKKAKELKGYYKDNYFFVGPYYTKSASSEFEEKTPPKEIEKVFTQLKKEGIICHYGTWLIEGKPIAFLVDFSRRFDKLKEIKHSFSKNYNVDLKTFNPRLKQKRITDDSMSHMNLNAALVWGDAAIRLIKELLKSALFKTKKGVVHFHSDIGKPVYGLIKDLKEENANVGLVATYHSTKLGRTIVTNKENLVEEIRKNLKKNKKVENKREYKYKGRVIPFHQFEALGAKNSDVITCVSRSTAKEVEYILGRKPDLITPNGLQTSTLPLLEERSVIHQTSKERIYKFLNAYFLPYYPIDIPHSHLFFTSGRYELTTKGYDLLLAALENLNKRLKKEQFPNTIFVFLFIMIAGKEANDEILSNMAVYGAIEHTVAQEFPYVEKRIISSLVHGHEIKRNLIFDEHFLIESKKLMLKFKRKSKENPPICAFKGLKKDDVIMQLLKKCGLDNSPDDKVKVIFYPAPVSVADGLLSMEYNEVMAGMHLGVFPSMYEPWGYTPLETAAHGVMSITTDVAGFGKFIQENSDQRKKPGILVLNTIGKKREDIVSGLADTMYGVVSLSRNERINKKLEAYKLAMLADWSKFAKHYIRAHNLAIQKMLKRTKS